jgi:hypothetical protein
MMAPDAIHAFFFTLHHQLCFFKPRIPHTHARIHGHRAEASSSCPTLSCAAAAAEVHGNLSNREKLKGETQTPMDYCYLF